MGEEGTKDKKSPEMTPQEDGTKVPLTNENTASIEEAKYVSNPNGDAKIDVEVPPTFSGLTKEELMKYSKDPFWVRLRWVLFVLFWAGWLAMLVMAIVIIIQAPGCEPPPKLLWVEEKVMVELESTDLPPAVDLVKKCDEIGVSSVYLPDLISISNFEDANYDAQKLIDEIVKAEKQVVTDLPRSVDPVNPFYENATDLGLIMSDSSWNYTNERLPSFIYKEVVEIWISKGITGFLMREADTPEKVEFKKELNGLCEEKKGAVGSDIIDTDGELNSPSMIRDFLEDNSGYGNWSFFKYNPNYMASGSEISEEDQRLITMALFLAPGTPVLSSYNVNATTAKLIKTLSGMKSLNGIKFGNTSFVNSTDSVVAYTRVYKGTPAYAVALNFNDYNTTVSFDGMDHIAEKGTVEIYSTEKENLYETRERKNMKDIFLGPFEGIVLQFVAQF